MKLWRLILAGAIAVSTIACGLAAWRAAFVPPTALIPAGATDVRLRERSLSSYQATYQATSGFFDWRGSTIRRLTAAGWVRGANPDSTSFDRRLWFVRRRAFGFLTVIEQVSMRAGNADPPLVVLRYQRTIRIQLFEN
jgi:hypothetical protein